MKKIFTRRRLFCIAVIIAVIIVPLLYSYFYLGAFWDPYSKLDKLPVAVVNNDKGAVINDSERNLGKEMCDRLKKDGTLKFIFTDEKDAKSGTEGTDYYATITIPENFSKNIASAATTEKQTATITYSPNEKRNFLASQILNRAVLEIEEETRSNVDKELVQELTDNMKEVPDQLTKLQDGLTKLGNGSSKLLDGTNTLADGTKTLLSGTNKLANGSNSLLAGTKTLSAGTGSLVSGTKKLSNGSSTLANGTKTFQAKFKKYKDGVASVKAGSTKLESGAEALQTGISQVKAGTDQLVDKTSNIGQITSGAKTLSEGTKTFDTSLNQYTTGVNTLISNVNSTSTFLAQYVKKHPSLMADPEFAAFITKMSDPTNAANIQTLLAAGPQLTTASSQLTNGAATLYTGTQDLPALNTALQTLSAGAAKVETGSKSLTAGAKTLNTGVASLSSATNKLYNASGDIADGAASLNDGASDLNSGASKLNSGASDLTDGAASLNTGANKLNTGAKDLNSGANDLKDGTDKLNSGISKAKSKVSKSIEDTNKKIDKLNGLDEYAATPVNVKQKNVTYIANYGTAFAPYFMSLSLWVGALILFVGIYLDTEGKFKIMSRESNHRVARSFLFLLVGFGQAVGLALIVKDGLGLKVDNIPLFYFSICLVSLVFISIVQFLIIHLKSVGKLLSVVLLILQLTSCGGTFPMETVPKMFNVMYPFMPMTYSVALFKQAITKTDTKAVLFNCSILFAILIVFMVLTILLSAIKARRAVKAEAAMPVQYEN